MATVENGCVWYTVGSQHEPIYPDPEGQGAALSNNLSDLGTIENSSATDEAVNGLTRVAKKYAGKEVGVEAEPGDVVFFGGHIIHRSHANRSDYPRRSFVGHFCNARSFVPWNALETFEGDAASYLHILARGTTHLSYAQPRFGTPCAANKPEERKKSATSRPISMMPDEDGTVSPSHHADKDDID